MKRTLLAVLVTFLGGFAAARDLDRAPDLPTLGEFRERMAEQGPAKLVQGRAIEARRAGCPVPQLSGSTMGRGMFSMTFDVKLGDQKLGEIEPVDGGWLFRDNAGHTIALASVKTAEDSRVATVTDCSGARIGEVSETQVGSSESVMTIKDAQGKTVATSNPASSGEMDLKSPSGDILAQSRDIHWLLDRYAFVVVNPEGVDGRMVLIASVMGNSAAYRRSAERRRDRIGDRPGPGNKF